MFDDGILDKYINMQKQYTAERQKSLPVQTDLLAAKQKLKEKMIVKFSNAKNAQIFNNQKQQLLQINNKHKKMNEDRF